MTLITTSLQDAFWAGVATMGFAMLFNVPRHHLLASTLIGMLGHAARTLLIHFGLAAEPATLAAAMLVGAAGTFWAQRRKVPALIFTIPGAIPMIPGVFAYRAMIGILSIISIDPTHDSAVLVEAAVYAIRTGLILAAIAVGIAFPTLLLQRLKPIV